LGRSTCGAVQRVLIIGPMRIKLSVAAVAAGLLLAALPTAAFATEDPAEVTSPPELVLPPGCDYSAGECPIVFDPEADKCVVSRERVWVARDGEWTIINWTWGANPELDAAVKAADNDFTQWIVNGDIDALNAACGFKHPAESETPSVPADPSDESGPSETSTENPSTGAGNGGDGSEEPPPTGTPEPEGGDSNQTGLPPIPAECDQGNGRYVCPDGNPPYGCWAITAPDRPSADDPPASDGSDRAYGSSKSHARVVGLCIDPIEEPPEVPINLCDWEPMSCEGPIDPPALPSCTLGDDDNPPVCFSVIPHTWRKDGTVPPRHKSKSKPKARARTHSGRKAKLHGTKKPKATRKHAAKKPASKKSPKVAKKKQKASRR